MKRRSHSIDMLNGPLAGKILIFALPLMASSLIQQLFNTADTIIVGRFAGSEALAAVGSCGYLVNLFVTFFVGFSMGSNVAISQAFGANDLNSVRRSVHTSISFSLVCGVLMAILGYFFAPMLLRIMSVPDDIIDMASLYVRIYFLGSPASTAYNFGAAILRSQGDTKRPLYYLTATGVLNVVLNLIFVIVFHMTTDGVALATILSQYLSAFLVIRCLCRENGPLRLELRHLSMDRHIVGSIIRIGLPSGLENSLYCISNMTIQSAINSFGSAVIAGGSAASSINGLASIPHASVNQAILTFASQNYGAKQYKRVDRVVLLGFLYSTGISLLLTNLCVLFAEPLLSIYLGSEILAIQEGAIRMRTMYPFSFLAAIMGSMTCALRALGYSMIPMVVAIIGTCGLRVLWVIFVLPLFGTVTSLYIIWPISWAVTAITLGIFFLAIRRKVYEKAALQL